MKRWWPNLRHSPGFRMEGLRKTTKYLSLDSQSPDGDLNPGPTEYEAGVLSTQPGPSEPSVKNFGFFWYDPCGILGAVQNFGKHCSCIRHDSYPKADILHGIGSLYLLRMRMAVLD
jgi:hypothetical protein